MFGRTRRMVSSAIAVRAITPLPTRVSDLESILAGRDSKPLFGRARQTSSIRKAELLSYVIERHRGGQQKQQSFRSLLSRHFSKVRSQMG